MNFANLNPTPEEEAVLLECGKHLDAFEIELLVAEITENESSVPAAAAKDKIRPVLTQIIRRNLRS